MLNRSAAICMALAAAALLLFPTATRAADEEECFRCHGLQGLASRQGEEVRPLAINAEYFESSVHSLLNCRECHSDISAIPHPGASRAISCGQACHQRDQAGNVYSHESLFWEYTTSIHGETTEQKITCTTCHPAQSLGKVVRRNLAGEAEQCAACHTDSVHVEKYFSSIHYLALSQGNRRAPSCPDCHTAHSILPAGKTESSTHSDSIARTCGSGALGAGSPERCHGNLPAKDFKWAEMNPLLLPGSAPGITGWFFTALTWALLLTFLARMLIGLSRKR